MTLYKLRLVDGQTAMPEEVAIPKGSNIVAGGKRSATTGQMLEGNAILKGSDNLAVVSTCEVP